MARPFFLGLILLAAAVLRGCGARGDLWLDEIWSLRMSQQVDSPIGILTELHHDNNHHLNTLFLRLLGPDAEPIAYRSLSILAGLGTIVLAYHIGRQRGDARGWIAASLFTLSFPMIVYASEARGYALAVFFALATYASIERSLGGGGPAAGLLFGVTSILGLLSHPTFLYAYIAASCWWAARLLRQRTGVPGALRGLLEVHALPLLAFAFIYLLDLRYFAAGGGDPSSWTEVFVRAFSLVLGGPAFTGAALACGALAIAAALYALFVQGRERSDAVVFFTVVLFIAPAVLRAAAPAEAIYERYFLVALTFFLLLLADLLARLFRLGKSGRAAVIAFLVLFALGNSVHCARFFRFGRGSYLETVRFLRDSTGAPVVTVGSDHDFRNRLVLEFAIERLGRGKPVALYELGTWPEPGPEWFLAHRHDPAPMPPSERPGPSGETYRLVRVFRYGGLSGWDWLVYRRD